MSISPSMSRMSSNSSRKSAAMSPSLSRALRVSSVMTVLGDWGRSYGGQRLGGFDAWRGIIWAGVTGLARLVGLARLRCALLAFVALGLLTLPTPALLLGGRCGRLLFNARLFECAPVDRESL